MLRSLYISNFIIIDKVNIDFYEGMSALTGETGAGKSIIVDAIGQLCGNRTSSQFVRKGTDKAVIEGIFDVNDNFIKRASEYNIDIEDELVITKEIFSNGKSSIKINYRSVSLTILKRLMPYLLDIHSQFETQNLFEVKKHIHILDDYIGNDISKLKADYNQIYLHYKQQKKQLNDMIHEDLSDEQIEFYQAQVREIEESEYSDEEVEEFENELKRLENYEKTNEYIQSFIRNMSNNVIPGLNDSIDELSRVNDDEFNEYYDQLYNQYYVIRDIYDQVVDTFNDIHFDEYRFNELQDILFKINRLKRKYGYSMVDILEAKSELNDKINIILNRDEYISKLEKEISLLENQCYIKAKEMHNIRCEYAQKFEKEMSREFNELYLSQARFHIDLKKGDLNNLGYDNVVFMIATNKGQELSLLNETASGGEISRIMLAIKTIILRDNEIETILFDEVDTGVSGKVASSIGEKMKQLGHYKQVISITHLPQVACKADYHYVIEKKSDDESTVSSIHLLADNERVEELAKMLSDDHISEEARKNAKRLLNIE